MPAVAGSGVHTALYVAKLNCLHEISFSVGEPTTGDLIWCSKCYDYREVMHLSGKYGARCENCRYARNYGGRLSAMTKGTAHSIKYIGHRVTVWGPSFEEVIYNKPQLLDFDLPPF